MSDHLHTLIAKTIRHHLNDLATTPDQLANQLATTILNLPELVGLAEYAAGAAVTEAEQIGERDDTWNPASPTDVLETAGVTPPVIAWLQDHMT